MACRAYTEFASTQEAQLGSQSLGRPGQQDGAAAAATTRRAPAVGRVETPSRRGAVVRDHAPDTTQAATSADKWGVTETTKVSDDASLSKTTGAPASA